MSTISYLDLFNPQKRVPIVICLDTSASMEDPQKKECVIPEICNGLRLLKDEISKHPIASDAADIAILTFHGNPGKGESFQLIKDFGPINNWKIPDSLLAYSSTYYTKVLEASLKMLDERIKEYQESALCYYNPWIVFMTDGQPSDPNSKIWKPQFEAIQKEIASRIQNKKLQFYTFLYTGNLDSIQDKEECRSFLRAFYPKNFPNREKMPYNLNKRTQFNGFFNFVSASIQSIELEPYPTFTEL